MTAVVVEDLVPDEDHSNGAAWPSTRTAGLPDHIRPWTPNEQADHYAALTEAVSDWHWHDNTRISTRRRTAARTERHP